MASRIKSIKAGASGHRNHYKPGGLDNEYHVKATSLTCPMADDLQTKFPGEIRGWAEREPAGFALGKKWAGLDLERAEAAEEEEEEEGGRRDGRSPLEDATAASMTEMELAVCERR